MNTQIIEFLKTTPNSNKAAITVATGIKGLQLFNLLKQMLKDGQIISSGDGNETTYLVVDVSVETPMEQPHVETVNEAPSEGQEVTTVHNEAPPIVEQPLSNEVIVPPAVVDPEKNTGNGKPQETVVTKTTERDNSKFLFNGIEMNKSQLVRSIVAHYVAQNQGITYKKLKEIFPDTLLKRFGIFQDEEKAREISGKKYDRYFFKEEHVIKLKDKRLVVSNQITATNLLPLLDVAKNQLGYDIK